MTKVWIWGLPLVGIIGFYKHYVTDQKLTLYQWFVLSLTIPLVYFFTFWGLGLTLFSIVLAPPLCLVMGFLTFRILSNLMFLALQPNAPRLRLDLVFFGISVAYFGLNKSAKPQGLIIPVLSLIIGMIIAEILIFRYKAKYPQPKLAEGPSVSADNPQEASSGSIESSQPNNEVLQIFTILFGLCAIIRIVWIGFLQFKHLPTNYTTASGDGWLISFLTPTVPAFLICLAILIWRKIKYANNNPAPTTTEAIPKPELSPTVPKPAPRPQVTRQIIPLFGAILAKDIDLVRTALQDDHAALNIAYAQNGNTPLHVAALNGQTEIVRLLLAQPGIDKTIKNNDGKTAFDLAQEKGFAEIVELLENN